MAVRGDVASVQRIVGTGEAGEAGGAKFFLVFCAFPHSSNRITRLENGDGDSDRNST